MPLSFRMIGPLIFPVWSHDEDAPRYKARGPVVETVTLGNSGSFPDPTETPPDAMEKIHEG